MARAWREALDPDGAEQREEQLRAQRGLKIGREVEGMTRFWGACDPASAAQLRAALAASPSRDAEPRFLSEAESAGNESIADGELPARIHDPRTLQQRQLDVLLGLLTAGMRSTEQGSVASVTAVINLDDLETGKGTGWLDGVDEPVCAETIRELVCDAGFRRAILGNDGEVLALGRRERYFSRSQRRALATRDGGCIWPLCTAPPSRCHAHHVVPWSLGGETDIDNGALLCAAHHHMLHNSPFTLKMIRGRPRLLAPPWLDPSREWKTLGRSRVRMRPIARPVRVGGESSRNPGVPALLT
jgi:hypothetical protein